MQHIRVASTIVMLAGLLGGCASWSTSDVKPSTSATTNPAPSRANTQPASIVVTEKDITDRKYRVLGDVSVTVNKSTIFNANPTREMVAEKLRAEAAKLGADAVVLVRYGTVGVSLMSWGSLSGKGRAVAFVK